MSEKLLESDFLSADLRSIFNSSAVSNTAEEPATEKTAASEALPAPKDWEAWGDLLNNRLKANNELSSEAKYTEYEVESKFFKEFFSINWGKEAGKKLDLIGEPLKKALKVLKFDSTKNPILGFILQENIIKLINTDKLNANTFKAIYNAVAKRQVAAKEFFVKNKYNIIYCPDLYDKSLAEIEKYLELQSDVLKEKDTDFNKRVFLNTAEVTEQDPEKRAKAIISLTSLPKDIEDVSTAKLNSLKLAQLIGGKKRVSKVNLDANSQKALVTKLDQLPDKFAAILALSLSTDSAKAKQELSNEVFNKLDNAAKVEAILKLAAGNTMPKGQLNTADADALVAKIIAAASQAQA